MASKAKLFGFACLVLVIATRVSANNEDVFVEDTYPTVPAPPLKVSAPPPPIVNPSPLPPPVYKPVPVPPPAKQLPLPPLPPVKASPPPPPPLVYRPVPAPAPPVPVKAPPPPPPSPPRNTKECYPLCVVRCKNHSRKNVCLRACVTCCDRCKCVPPGQYGNREKCGKCYANMTTRGRRLKCP